ncbi:MAG: T9SS type A sorting domain-containing protein [Saprospiraceae bacterium]|nr:T9SS type A sorting domain-containing protein [Candidatus Defluviibacterium haderslevense]
MNIPMKLLDITIVFVFFLPKFIFSQSFIYNSPAAEDSWGIISVLELPNHYLITNSDYNLTRDSVYCKMSKVSKAGKWISDEYFVYSAISRSEFFTKINQQNYLTILALDKDPSINQFVEINLETRETQLFPLNQRIDISANDILNIGDTAYLFAYYDTKNQLPRLLKVNRNNGQLKYSRILQAAPSDIKFTLDGKHILVKGLGDIDIFNFNLDTILVSYFSQYYGDLVGDIKPLPNKNKYINSGGQLQDVYHFDHQDTVDLGICLLDSNLNVIENYTFGRTGDTVDIPARTQSIADTEGGFYFGGTSNFKVWTYPYGFEPSWYMIIKTDSTLNVKWKREFGGDAYYFMTGIIGTSDGGCLAYGTRQDTAKGNHNRDGFMIKYDKDGLVTFTKTIPSGVKKNLIVYPNPASSHITIKGIDDLNHYNIKIYNDAGIQQNGFTIQNNKDSVVINVSDWSRGIYIISMYNKNGILMASEKILVK